MVIVRAATDPKKIPAIPITQRGIFICSGCSGERASNVSAGR
jgi:hypothetical protein